MNRFAVLLLIVFSGWLRESCAQQLQRTVVSASGNSSTVSGYSLSATVGQAVYTTGVSGNYFITQGFQQPSLIIITEPSYQDAADAYPNPVGDELTIKFYVNKVKKYTVEIFSVMGNLVHTENFYSLEGIEKRYIDFSEIPRGVYFIHIFSDNKIVNRIIKIEKM